MLLKNRIGLDGSTPPPNGLVNPFRLYRLPIESRSCPVLVAALQRKCPIYIWIFLASRMHAFGLFAIDIVPVRLSASLGGPVLHLHQRAIALGRKKEAAPLGAAS